MAKKHGPVFAGIIATVVGGIILTLLTWAWGKLPAVWHFIQHGASFVLGTLTYEAQLPIWVLALIILACVVATLWWKTARVGETNRTDRVMPSSGEVAQTVVAAEQLTENEETLVRVFANGDGRWFLIEDLVEETRLRALLIEQGLDGLLQKKFLLQSHNYVDGTSCRLSPKGRDYAIGKGYVC